MVQVSTQFVSFNNSQPFQLAATTSGTPDILHTANGAVGEVDSIFATATNISAGARTVSFIVAGSSDFVTLTLQSGETLQLLPTPLRIQQGQTFAAFCDTPGFAAGDISIVLRIDRLTNPPAVPSTQATSVVVSHPALNYTPTDGSTNGHLAGIDAALPNSGGGSAPTVGVLNFDAIAFGLMQDAAAFYFPIDGGLDRLGANGLNRNLSLEPTSGTGGNFVGNLTSPNFAVSGSGSNLRRLIGDAATFDPGHSEWAIIALIRTNSGGPSNEFICGRGSVGNDAGPFFELSLGSAQPQLRVTNSAATTLTVNSSVFLAGDQVRLLIGEYSAAGGTIQLFLDGDPPATENLLGFQVDSGGTLPFEIGGTVGGGQTDLEVMYVILLNRLTTQPERDYLFNSGSFREIRENTAVTVTASGGDAIFALPAIAQAVLNDAAALWFPFERGIDSRGVNRLHQQTALFPDPGDRLGLLQFANFDGQIIARLNGLTDTFDPGDTDWAIVALIRGNPAISTATPHIICGKFAAGAQFYSLGTAAPSGQFVFEVGDGAAAVSSVTSTVAIAASAFYAVIAEHSASSDELSITVNGITTTAATAIAAGSGGVTPFELGGRSSGSISSDLQVGYVIPVNRLLTQPEKDFFFNGGSFQELRPEVVTPTTSANLLSRPETEAAILSSASALWYPVNGGVEAIGGAGLDQTTFNQPALGSVKIGNLRFGDFGNVVDNRLEGRQNTFDPGDTNWTVICLVHTNSSIVLTSDHVVFGKWDDPARYYRLLHSGTNQRWEFFVGDGAAQEEATVAGSATIADTTYLIIVEHESGASNTIRMTLNGVEQTPTVLTIPPLVTGGTDDFEIGASAEATPPVAADLQIGYVVTVDRLLTADEKSYLFNGGSFRDLQPVIPESAIASPLQIANDGVNIGSPASRLNFGSGVTASEDATPGEFTINAAATGVSGHVIQDGGSNLAQRANLNFVGAGVSATDDLGNDATVITIPGSGAPALVIVDVTANKTLAASDFDTIQHVNATSGNIVITFDTLATNGIVGFQRIETSPNTVTFSGGTASLVIEGGGAGLFTGGGSASAHYRQSTNTWYLSGATT